MTETLTIEVCKTTDYETLKGHELQPSGRVRADGELVASLKRTDGNAFHPILVSRDTMTIIDGHRRFMASMIAKTPVYYRLADMDEEALFMATMNSTGRQWSTKNYIEHFAVNDSNYKDLLFFIKEQSASVEMVRLFGGIDLRMLKVGADISHLDYKHLQEVRLATRYISALFDIRDTTSVRALRKVYKNIHGFSIEKLVKGLKEDRKNGEFKSTSLTSIAVRLEQILLKSYKKRR